MNASRTPPLPLPSRVIARHGGIPRLLALAAILLLGLVVLLSVALGSALGLGSVPVVTLRGTTYVLHLEADGRASLESRGGTTYTTLPLEMAARGAATAPGRVIVHRGSRPNEAVVDRIDWAGNLLEEATVVASPRFLTVSFSAAPGAFRGAVTPLFFTNGTSGIDLSMIRAGWSPIEHTLGPTPAVTAAGWVPLAPAPLDVELEGQPGWFGLGLVQVPDAETLAVDPDGSVEVDYPLRILRSIPDRGAGGMSGGRLRFPSFVITFGHDPLQTLAAYRDALVSLGTAPAAPLPSSQPSWWREPIVDTWGEQMAERAQRDSPAYTSQWVRQFVTEARQRLALPAFTVVIDAYWQESIGDPTPDPARFGGYVGMRQLVDWLHAQGLKVMLWWPIWDYHLAGLPPPGLQAQHAVSPAIVDPTSPTFQETMTVTMERLLGSGPGDLDADGLKIDWAYDIPEQVERPALGWGTAALYRYLEIIHQAAHRVRPDALIETSAAAPQFAGVTDAIRLYDAWQEASWDRRAAVVSTADPGLLIDGDGWAANPTDIVPHTVSSAVYGVPAFYFVARWANGRPIPVRLLRLLGKVAMLSPLKGEGVATPLPDGEWRYTSEGMTTAQSLAGNEALVVWQRGGCDASLCGDLLSVRAGELAVPVPVNGNVILIGPRGRSDLGRPVGGTVQAHLLVGVTYSLRVS
jgi:hypothetical protein